MTADPPTSLAAALVALQANLPKIERNQEGQVGSRPYRYADLAAISDTMFPRLSKLGLAFLATPAVRPDGQPVLRCSLLHISGQREDGEFELPRGAPPQQIGSAITYGRRYTLASMLGLASEEDRDGAMDGASGGQRRTRRAPARPPADGEARKPSQAKLAAMFARMAELGITKREDALAFVSDKSGHTVESRSELTDEDVSKVLAATNVKPVDDPVAGVDAFPDEAKP